MASAPVSYATAATTTAAAVSTDPYEQIAYKDALDDVHTRFILNLPESELQTADRIFFQLEQAWWFYEDMICDVQGESCTLPRFSTLKPFSQKLFSYSPLLPDSSKFTTMWAQFGNYKRKISNYGCILLSQDLTKMVLCRIWDSKTYTLPAGKINQGEDGATAAARETYEETGFDPGCTFGLTAEWKDSAATATDNSSNITWKTPLLEENALVFTEDSGKRRTSYVCHGVPADFPFAPVCRKEVASVEWHPLDDLPRPSFAVMPFLPQLRRWIKKHRKDKNKKKTVAGRSSSSNKSRERGTKAGSGSRNSSRNGSRGRVIRGEDDALVVAGLAEKGEISGWSETDMFQANEKLSGHKVEYDGNPHVFAEKGFGGKQDPHAFHVVGGGFLNAASGVQSLAPPPDQSKLQPLFRTDEGRGESGELQPFFSDDGATPWGEIVAEAKDASSPPRKAANKEAKPKKKKEKKHDAGKALLASLQGKSGGADKKTPIPAKPAAEPVMIAGSGAAAFADMFLTDAEITARSQADKTTSVDANNNASKQALREKYNADMEFVRAWVAKLPKPSATKHFGTFKLDADALLAGTPLATPRSTR